MKNCEASSNFKGKGNKIAHPLPSVPSLGHGEVSLANQQHGSWFVGSFFKVPQFLYVNCSWTFFTSMWKRKISVSPASVHTLWEPGTQMPCMRGREERHWEDLDTIGKHLLIYKSSSFTLTFLIELFALSNVKHVTKMQTYQTLKC